MATKFETALAALNPRHQLFVKSFVSNGYKPAAAALAANYSARSAPVTAQKLLANPKIAAAVTAHKEKLFQKYDVTAERVVQELAYLGFSNMDDYVRRTEDGGAVLDIRNCTREQMAAVQQLESEVYVEGGEDGEAVKRTKFRLHGKRDALELLGKHVGVFKEDAARTEVQVRILHDGNKAAVAVDVRNK